MFGYLGDKIGRVRAMSLSILVYSLFTGFCYFAGAPWQIGALRFIAAVGMGGEWSLGVALVMEVWPSRFRPLLAGVIGAASNVGFLLIAFICFIFPVSENNWRWIMLAGAAPAMLTFFVRLFVPESEKWQESQKHGPTAPLKEAFTGKTAKSMWLAIVFASVALLGTWGAVQKIPAWVDNLPLASQPGIPLKDRVLLGFDGTTKDGRVVISTVSGTAATASGVASGMVIETVAGKPVASIAELQTVVEAAIVESQKPWTDGGRKGPKPALPALPVTARNGDAPVAMTLPFDTWSPDPRAKAVCGMLMAVGAIIGCLIAPLIGAKLGRRPTYFLLCVTSLVVCAYMFRAFDRYDSAFMFMAFLAGGVSAAFYGWLPLYLPELFPTRVRATAQGVAFNFGRIFAAAGALMGSNLMLIWGDYAKMGAAISLIYVVGMIVIWFAPETKGKPLPE